MFEKKKKMTTAFVTFFDGFAAKKATVIAITFSGGSIAKKVTTTMLSPFYIVVVPFFLSFLVLFV